MSISPEFFSEHLGVLERMHQWELSDEDKRTIYGRVGRLDISEQAFGKIIDGLIDQPLNLIGN